jgi:membrane protease YdiL (CAAX protease family)
MPLTDAALSALLNVVLLAGIPFLGFYLYHRLRHRRGLREVAERAGLRLGETHYLWYSLAVAVLMVFALVAWPPDLEPFTRERSPQRPFVGLGLGGDAITLAVLYGVIKTGFAEELLFRGLIAGSLGRWLGLTWGNRTQAVIFLVPHVPVVVLAPQLWWVLILVFAGALFTGWVRLKSGSILGPWLNHAVANVTICLSVAGRTAEM